MHAWLSHLHGLVAASVSHTGRICTHLHASCHAAFEPWLSGVSGVSGNCRGCRVLSGTVGSVSGVCRECVGSAVGLGECQVVSGAAGWCRVVSGGVHRAQGCDYACPVSGVTGAVGGFRRAVGLSGLCRVCWGAVGCVGCCRVLPGAVGMLSGVLDGVGVVWLFPGFYLISQQILRGIFMVASEDFTEISVKFGEKNFCTIGYHQRSAPVR